MSLWSSLPSLSLLLLTIGWGWALCVTVISVVAIVRALRRRRGESSAGASASLEACEVHLCRPCAGNEAHLEENLCSIERAHFSFSLRLTLGVCDEEDSAWPVIQRAAERLRRAGYQAEAAVFEPFGPNRKQCQLAGAQAQHESPFFMGIDSDVDLSHTDLDRLLRPICDEEVAMAWSSTMESNRPRTFADRMSQAFLAGSLHAFPLLSSLDANTISGKMFALRSDALRAAGGFRSLVEYLGEDMELGRRLRAKGYRIEATSLLAQSQVGGRSLFALLERYGRLARGYPRPASGPSAQLSPFVCSDSLSPAPIWRRSTRGRSRLR